MTSSSTPSPGNSPDAHASGFLEAPPNALRYEHSSMDLDDIGRKLASLIAPHSHILDVGCGTGSVTDLLRHETQGTIIGIEPDVERAQRAAARGLDVHQGILSADFLRQHGPFDYIVFADVLEHLPNPAEIVVLAKGGLREGGSLIASLPNVAHWFVRTDLLWGRFNYQDCGIMDATHLRWFTQRTAQEFFERLGFQITAFEYTLNLDLPDYKRRAPWRWMQPRLRRRLVRRLAKAWPGLFSSQHILRATLLT